MKNNVCRKGGVTGMEQVTMVRVEQAEVLGPDVAVHALDVRAQY